MSLEPTVQPLSYVKRVWFFRTLLAIFLISMPVFVFYAMGYRIDLQNDARNIISVGGMYISASAEDIEMYVDDEPVENMRIFQNAAYIQNLEAGVYQIHVQREGLQTWVKDLPVFSHIVTEAYAFNMPLVPQVRAITEWRYGAASVYVAKSSTTSLFTFASTTNSIYATTSSATSTYATNSEYEYVLSLFGTTSASSTETALDRAVETIEQKFSFATTTLVPVTPAATTTKEWQDIRLYESNGDVYAAWIGDTEDIPYYYCLTYTSPATTSQQYGAHVYEALTAQLIDGIDLNQQKMEGEQFCRDHIRIDDKGQEVIWFDFYPDSAHLVLMLLTDGLYVVEIDDRAWQNTQLLYPGEGLEVVLDGGHILIFDGEKYFEVLTEKSL